MNDEGRSGPPPQNVTPPWTVSPIGGVPPPPPPPPAAYAYSPAMWQPTPGWQPEPPTRSRSRRVIAAGLAAIFAAGVGAGLYTGRFTAAPGTSDTSTTTIPTTPPTSVGGTGSGGDSANSGAAGGASDRAAIAAKVTPGIVNVNITLAGGSAAGTGMVITTTGQVLTNNHVIDGETTVSVQLPSTGRTYSAQVLGYDVADDVSLLQIQGGGRFTTVSVGDSSTVTVGQPVVALGNAQGRNTLPQVSSGKVTALNQAVTATDQNGGSGEHISGLIQVDAPIQPGDSGGPLVNSSAAVIGMNTAAEVARASFNGQSSSTAYAIPINRAIAVVKQIQSGKSTTTIHVGNTRPLIGIGVADSANGVTVNTVEAGSAAARAGIAVGSVITSVDGTTIDTNSTLRGVLVAHNPGDGVSIAWTDAAGASHTASITLGSGPPS